MQDVMGAFCGCRKIIFLQFTFYKSKNSIGGFEPVNSPKYAHDYRPNINRQLKSLILILITAVYIAPLQGNLLRSAGSQTWVKQCGLKAREKKSRVGYWRQAQHNRETIPSRRTSHREGSALSDNSPCTRDQQLRLGRRA